MTEEIERQEVWPHLRDERATDGSIVVVQGGPTMLAQLADHAHRTRDAFVLDGQPLWVSARLGVAVAAVVVEPR